MEPDYRALVDSCKYALESKKREELILKKNATDIQNRLSSLKKIHTIFKEAAVMSQDFLSEYIQNIVTDSLKVVFPDHDTKFNLEFVTTRDTQCIPSLEVDGRKISMFDSDGYGALDIVSISLRAAYIILEGSEKLLILDEPFRNLSLDRHELAARMLQGLSHKLGIQIIINTHLTHITDFADAVIRVEYDHKHKRSIVRNEHETVLEERGYKKDTVSSRGKRFKSKRINMQ